jgi:hypothetical protein
VVCVPCLSKYRCTNPSIQIHEPIIRTQCVMLRADVCSLSCWLRLWRTGVFVPISGAPLACDSTSSTAHMPGPQPRSAPEGATLPRPGLACGSGGGLQRREPAESARTRQQRMVSWGSQAAAATGGPVCSAESVLARRRLVSGRETRSCASRAGAPGVGCLPFTALPQGCGRTAGASPLATDCPLCLCPKVNC